eukprot:scaffold7969_cov56-Attheya_sp.AAC.2
MAPAVSKLAWDMTIKLSISAPSVVNPSIPFFKPTSKQAPKTDLNKFDCYLDPSDKDSDTFPEEDLLINTDKARFQIVHQILEGEGRHAFDNAATSSILKLQVDLQAEEKVGELATDVESSATPVTQIPKKKKASTLTVMGDVKEGPFEDAIKGLFQHIFPVGALKN